MNYNNTSQILPCILRSTFTSGVILPHSNKFLTFQDIDERIKKTRDHINHLTQSVSHRQHTHGGKGYRARRVTVQNQIVLASKKLELLQSASQIGKNLLLVDLNKAFPVQYTNEFFCSKDTLQKTIEEVASFVSQVFASFPKLKEERREQLRKQGVWIKNPSDFPSAEECEQFETSLKKAIIIALNQEGYSSITLSTDYQPEKALLEICKSVFSHKSQVSSLFPWKTCTVISLEENKKKLWLDMDFKGPSY